MEKIDPRLILIQVAKILDDLEIPYIVTGGIAVLVWGRPRFTADVDIIVEMKESKVDVLKNALMSLSEYGYIDRDAMIEALKNKGEFNFIDGFTGVKVDFWVTRGGELGQLEFKRKKIKTILRKKVNFISPEDLILRKLVWYKESQSSRHLEDVHSELKISNDIIDKKYLKKTAIKLNVLDELNSLLKDNGKSN